MYHFDGAVEYVGRFKNEARMTHDHGIFNPASDHNRRILSLYFFILVRLMLCPSGYRHLAIGRSVRNRSHRHAIELCIKVSDSQFIFWYINTIL